MAKQTKKSRVDLDVIFPEDGDRGLRFRLMAALTEAFGSGNPRIVGSAVADIEAAGGEVFINGRRVTKPKLGVSRRA